MQYRTFGKTGEKVSALGFGAMRLPIIDGDYSKVDEDAAYKLFKHAVDNGLNYIDTSWPYHSNSLTEGGSSEPFVGRTLKKIGREKVLLATKLPIWAVKSREDMDAFLDKQLERLQTDHVDFYLVHNIMETTWRSVTSLGLSDFLDKALKSGKVRHVGFSFHDTPALFDEVLNYYDWSFCQHACNYFDTKFQAGLEGIDKASERGLGFVSMETVLGGMLADQIPEEAVEIFNATGIKRSPAGWALRWAWNRPQTSVLLSGMNTMEQLEENLSLADIALPNSLSEVEMEAYAKVRTFLKSRGTIPCIECGKCSCPNGVDIQQIFTIHNSNTIFKDVPFGCHQYDLMIAPSGHGAENCNGCGECESMCPQDINIAEEIQKIAVEFNAGA
ncbi:aldo/keto reductase [Maridesulfovibrio bastinii]|jgi:hypothetical protein|uniref:aldo/keto reductase n=1 Tax=Maridesulfovibrio bastinii TaxID=47157 RepID=UPI000408C306|nr:aldo/keto reductase [Maridesulfovibrio bastinii]